MLNLSTYQFSAYLILTQLLSLFMSLAVASAQIANPKEHLLSTSPPQGELLEMRFDLNNDGVPEIFLADSQAENGTQGNIWNVYISTKNGYFAAKELISFRQDTVYFGNFERFKGKVLLTYYHGSATSGALVAFQVFGLKLIETKVRTLHFDVEGSNADSKLYERLFGGRPSTH